MSSGRLVVIPPLSPRAHLTRPRRLPFPFGTSNVALFKLGRHCLWHGLRSIGLDAGGVLVPAYHHGSEIEVLRVAGLDLRFYDVTDSLEPNVDELTDSDLDGVRALYLIHYLGFPQNAGKWRRWCDDRGLLLIEDVAQGWLGNSDGRPLGAYGDVSIFCLYKQLGVPDGGALATTGDVSSVATRSLGVGRLFRRHAAWASSRSAALARLTPPHVDRPKEAIADAEFRLGDPWTPPSGATNYLLPRLCHPAVAEMRRDNYRYLADRLGDLIAPGFDGLPEGASPFAFPIAVGAKDSVYHGLIDRRMLVQDLWAVPHPSLTGDFPRSARLRQTVIALPVHQDLRRVDLDHIVRAVRSATSNG